MGQVVAAIGGVENTLGITVPPDTAEEPARLLAAVFAGAQEQVRSVVGLGDQLEQMQAARNALAQSGESLYSAVRAAEQRGAGSGLAAWLTSPWLPLGFVLIAVLALVCTAVLQRSLASLRRAADQQARQNERNQQAILRLLDELSSLADGDLTVQATVTEDITGAIADSINYAIEALRELVTTINDSAIKLDGATRQTQALSTHLAKAASAQSESIAAMAASTEEVSGNAERSADVARHSVDIAHKGGDAVRRTIDGMNAIRENIQETSKRIKRLGESSQEIGNIVELINDIAEQTNILALNASIQASMAGEAGRGFAVVADEVQRLAERAANSTKQIEVLVRTIQADTNEAVVSMERTTTDVVGGALLAENAGAALEEIEQVSNQIASLVQNISASARQQATSSQNISRNMQVLREISAQTNESTTATSTSIGKLAELAAQLRKSVTGFRLPEGPGVSVTGEFPMLRPEEPAAEGLERPRRVGGLSA
jgi:twitching motility protein PilJ